MRALQAMLERRKNQSRLQELSAEPVVLVELMAVELRVARRIDPGLLIERVLRLLDFFPQPDVAVLLPPAPVHVEHVVDLLQEHRDAFHAVRELARDRRQVDAADLLEIGELRDLRPVEHHLPADAPGAKRRRLPVVLLEPDVVVARVDADGLEAVEIDLLHFVGRRLEDHLQLMMLEQAIRILPEAAVVGTPRRLDVRDIPRHRTEHAQQGFRVRRAGAHLDVERLLDQAALRGPEMLQFENQVLERHVTTAAIRSRRERTVAPFRGASLSASDE